MGCDGSRPADCVVGRRAVLRRRRRRTLRMRTVVRRVAISNSTDQQVIEETNKTIYNATPTFNTARDTTRGWSITGPRLDSLVAIIRLGLFSSV